MHKGPPVAAAAARVGRWRVGPRKAKAEALGIGVAKATELMQGRGGAVRVVVVVQRAGRGGAVVVVVAVVVALDVVASAAAAFVVRIIVVI